VARLQLENARLKKAVKYTQIQELQAENQQLYQQLGEVKRCLEESLEGSEYE
jgi:hypothetical protein